MLRLLGQIGKAWARALFAIQIRLEHLRQAVLGPAQDLAKVSLMADGRECGVVWNTRVLKSRQLRSVGLLNHVRIAEGDGVLLVGTRSVHGIGMAFDVLAVFLDGDYRILGLEVLARGKGLRGPRGTRHILEIHTENGVHLVPGPDYTLAIQRMGQSGEVVTGAS